MYPHIQNFELNQGRVPPRTHEGRERTLRHRDTRRKPPKPSWEKPAPRRHHGAHGAHVADAEDDDEKGSDVGWPGRGE